MNKEARLQAITSQINRLESHIGELERLISRISWLRLIVFGLGIVITGTVFYLGYASAIWLPLLLTIVLFVLLVRYHRQVERYQTRLKIWREYKNTQVARARLAWEKLPAPLEQPRSSLGRDLDLSGPHSLHHLLNTAVSYGGGQRLLSWLDSTVPDPEMSKLRQQIVRELTPMALFRGKLFLDGTLASRENDSWNPDDLLKWVDDHQAPGWLAQWLAVLVALAVLNIGLFIANVAGMLPPVWQGTLLIYAILFVMRSNHLGEPFHESLNMRDALEQLMIVFSSLENYRYYRKPQLQRLCDPFLNADQRPSIQLRKINRIANATGLRGNPIFWLLLNALVPWDYFFAYQLSKAKEAIAKQLPRWLDVWFDLEALSSLANCAYLNPAYTFPTIEAEWSEKDKSPLLKTVNLGHPLIPDQTRVCNDFQIGTLGDIDIFTGSNMSGKSTFLRALGINLVLAQAGGAVNAESFETIAWRLYSCIQITDSVTDGISYFYAEVKCLKKLIEILDTPHSFPLLFLIDEIFRGTNNRERLTGSRAFIQAVAGKNGVGLVATHDLELVQLADDLSQVKNYHFRDDILSGRMVFDYKLYPGPSPTTNALKIMRAEGLPV